METPQHSFNAKQQQGWNLALSNLPSKQGGLWTVPSQTHTGTYEIRFDERQSCTCEDFELNQEWCKHIWAVDYTKRRMENVVIEPLPTRTKRPTYTQDWPLYNAAQCNEKFHFRDLLWSLCSGLEQPEYRRGRPRLAISDVVFSSIMKVYTTKGLRTADDDIQEARAQGFLDHAPHYNSISNYLCKSELTPILESLITESAIPLNEIEKDFAVDATGISTCTYVRWFDHKYGKQQSENKWMKLHISCGAESANDFETKGFGSLV